MQPLPLFAEAVLLLRPQIAHNIKCAAEIRAAPAASYLRAVPSDMRQTILQYIPDARVRAAEYLEEARQNFAQFCALYAPKLEEEPKRAANYIFIADYLRRDYPDLIIDRGSVVVKYLNGKVVLGSRYWKELHTVLYTIEPNSTFTLRGRLPCGLVYASSNTKHYIVDYKSGGHVRICGQFDSDNRIYDDYGQSITVHVADKKILELGKPSCYSAIIYAV